MTGKIALKVIFIISIVGLLFSGYLSYMEIFQGGCEDAIVKCSVGDKPVVDLGTLPACVYGLVMYLIIFIVAALGLKGKKEVVEKVEEKPEEPTQTEQ
ncbi:hypothetical protein KKB10_05600 [Patescibacteria group bacterium]|nr:hypothetical protein [Patescibacteria group bacterium]MBU1074875.1 hypothetical protein [Patescibacteria group bacterium]MBU1951531.1 hypothetical protein [Patescibacteria group bacterium]